MLNTSRIDLCKKNPRKYNAKIDRENEQEVMTYLVHY